MGSRSVVPDLIAVPGAFALFDLQSPARYRSSSIAGKAAIERLRTLSARREVQWGQYIPIP